MTVWELKEALADMPDDAVVMLKYEQDGYEQYVESVEFDEKRGIVLVFEVS